ncbi:MAG: hypothetical protein ACRDHE_17600 [Ktedonobacterales bacterium]
MRLSVSALLGLGWLLMAAAASGFPSAHALGTGSVSIIIPVPSGAATSGPVGANVTITASGLLPTDKYTLGYANATEGCSPGGHGPQIESATPNSDGSYSTTFTWPSVAHSTDTPYVICLSDATLPATPPIQSTTTFQVLDTSAPKIELKHVTSSVGAGTPTPAPQPDTSYYAGDVVQINGAHFPPGGLGANTTLGVYITSTPAKSFGDLSRGQQLTSTSGGLTPDSTNSFVARVTLPDATVITASGQYYLYVVSLDGSSTALPSLVASRQITVGPAPTPTPTATATSTTVVASPSATPGGQTGGASSNLGLIVGLGAISIVLFIVGVILLASAAGTPRGGQY